MPSFGKRSIDNLSTCHAKLQQIMLEAIKVYDFSVICGYRGQEAQDKAFNDGYSKVKYPDGDHNKTPSDAVDCMPWFKDGKHIRWDDKVSMSHLAGIIKGIAYARGIKIGWGGDYRNFSDSPHYYLIKE